jgi:ribosomal protein L11 methyltransferase
VSGASSGWSLSLSVPAGALPVFEAALESLGGALVVSGPDRGAVPLSLYLGTRPERPAVTALLAAAAAAAGVAVPGFAIETLPAVDWVAESQKALPPIRAGRFFVHGSHVAAPPPGAVIPIRIDANAAFGTGRHETTRGCLLALARLAKGRRFRRPLDMGCGSGVLAIAMAKLWPAPVLAVDNDATSVAVARENAGLNGVAARLRAVAGEGYACAEVGRRAPFDLVAANILAEPLCAMADDLARHLAPGGVAVLSGLLRDQERAVRARHRAQGLALAGRIELGDWTTLLVTRRKSQRGGPFLGTAAL